MMILGINDEDHVVEIVNKSFCDELGSFSVFIWRKYSNTQQMPFNSEFFAEMSRSFYKLFIFLRISQGFVKDQFIRNSNRLKIFIVNIQPSCDIFNGLEN